jgi:hypothetical protein
VGPVFFSLQRFFVGTGPKCKKISYGLMDRRIHNELILVGLGNLRFLQVCVRCNMDSVAICMLRRAICMLHDFFGKMNISTKPFWFRRKLSILHHKMHIAHRKIYPNSIARCILHIARCILHFAICILRFIHIPHEHSTLGLSLTLTSDQKKTHSTDHFASYENDYFGRRELISVQS